jgi:TetR/AcrR family transcriptional repressor of nem operon
VSRPKTRTNDPEGLRNRVLDVAAKSFQQSGFNSTSTHDLVRIAGVTGGALHHHFPTKKALVLAVIDERVAAEIGETWLSKLRDAPSAAAGINEAFQSVISALDAQASVSGCPLGNLALELSLSDPDVRRALAHQYDIWRTVIVERIRRDPEARESFAHDPHAFANVVIAMFTGAMTIAKAEQSTAALTATADQLRSIMLPRPRK